MPPPWNGSVAPVCLSETLMNATPPTSLHVNLFFDYSPSGYSNIISYSPTEI